MFSKRHPPLPAPPRPCQKSPETLRQVSQRDPDRPASRKGGGRAEAAGRGDRGPDTRPGPGEGEEGPSRSRQVQEPELVSARWPRGPSGPKGRERTRVPGRDGTKLGRTHEMLVEADQPRLPVVVENQNRLNHLRRPSFSKRCYFLKTSTSATTQTLPVGALLKVAGGNFPGCPGAGPRRVRFPGSRRRRLVRASRT